jgi:MFS superfamily sulfate permease-like transporter
MVAFLVRANLLSLVIGIAVGAVLSMVVFLVLKRQRISDVIQVTRELRSRRRQRQTPPPTSAAAQKKAKSGNGKTSVKQAKTVRPKKQVKSKSPRPRR